MNAGIKQVQNFNGNQKGNDMKWNKLYEYPKSIRSLINDARHYDIGDEKLPSVTTILSATQSEAKRASLAKWKQKVGENEAERVKNVAASRGTAMHTYLEHHIEGQGILDLTEIGQEAMRMAKTVIDKGFPDLEEIWGSEVTLYYPGLYAGATDLVVCIREERVLLILSKPISQNEMNGSLIINYKWQLMLWPMIMSTGRILSKELF
jgi:hypothetical protein